MLRFVARCSLVPLFIATTASAQQSEEAAPSAPPPPPASVAPAPPPAPPPVAGPTPDTPSDHDRLVHHVGVGYLGTSLLPIAVPPAGAGLPPTGGTVTAPAIGARYWFSRRIGLDAGLGFGFSAGSQMVNSASSAAPSSFGLDVHAGLPIALTSSSHYVFEVVPETLVGFTTGIIQGGARVPNQNLGGFLLNAGARVGSEIHFGFIGIPQLALQASVGVFLSLTSFRWSQGANSASVQSSTLSTSVQTSPWGIFVDNLSALYYF